MNSLLYSLFVMILYCFHQMTRSHILKGKVRESICALWCMDAIFCICGIIISFSLYNYSLFSFLTPGNAVWVLLYLGFTALFVLLAPSGLTLLTAKRCLDPETLVTAEYHFNDMLYLVRRFFMILLFVLPIIYHIFAYGSSRFLLSFSWTEAQICGGFCFIAFLLLLPVSLRQSFFWLKNLRNVPTKQEALLLHKYMTQTHYRKRNWRL